MPLNVFLIADGMGGEAQGEVASRIAARTVPAEMARGFAVAELLRPVEAASGDESSALIYSAEKPSLSTALARAVNEANRRVRDLATLIGQTTGTTLTVIATRGSQAALAHLGDSRAYLLRGETMARLTEDHSVLARLQAIDHPLLSDPDVFVPRNMLYRSLGQDDEASADTLDFTLVDGDRLLICSDGLWDEVDDYAIAETLASATDPRACAERLVTLANVSGGHDNSTAVVVFVRSAPNLDEARGSNGDSGNDADAESITNEANNTAKETPSPEER
jgi:protein phosphatase